MDRALSSSVARPFDDFTKNDCITVKVEPDPETNYLILSMKDKLNIDDQIFKSRGINGTNRKNEDRNRIVNPDQSFFPLSVRKEAYLGDALLNIAILNYLYSQDQIFYESSKYASNFTLTQIGESRKSKYPQVCDYPQGDINFRNHACGTVIEAYIAELFLSGYKNMTEISDWYINQKQIEEIYRTKELDFCYETKAENINLTLDMYSILNLKLFFPELDYTVVRSGLITNEWKTSDVNALICHEKDLIKTLFTLQTFTYGLNISILSDIRQRMMDLDFTLRGTDITFNIIKQIAVYLFFKYNFEIKLDVLDLLFKWIFHFSEINYYLLTIENEERRKMYVPEQVTVEYTVKNFVIKHRKSKKNNPMINFSENIKRDRSTSPPTMSKRQRLEEILAKEKVHVEEEKLKRRRERFGVQGRSPVV